MFMPEKMIFMDLVVMREARLELTRFLAKKGCLHIVEQHVSDDKADVAVKPWTGDKPAEDVCQEHLRTIELLLSQLEGEGASVDSDGSIDEVLSLDSEALLAKANHEIGELKEGIEALLKNRHDIEKRINRLDMISEELHLLQECQLSPSSFDSIRYLYAALGALPEGALARISSELEKLPVSVVSRSRAAAGDLVLLVGDVDKADEFDRLLNSAGFTRHSIDERYRVDYEAGMDLIEMDLWAARDELAMVNAKLKKASGDWVERLTYWKRVLKVQSVLLKATGGYGALGESVVLISGFVPESKGEKVVEGLEKRFAGRYVAAYRPAKEVEAEIEVPTKLKNWRIFRPFELFIKNYGLPRYSDIDPTPFMAISYLIMFGMMFGDVGHGAILAMAGACIAFLPYNIFVPARDLGKILMMSGLSGMVFGFLFGSLFGIENDAILPALWMRPSEGDNLTELMLVSLVIGIVIITLGIVLNIIQSFMKGDKAQALIGQWSLSSLTFFWMLLGLGLLSSKGINLPIPTWLIVVICALPLVLIVSGQLLLNHYGKWHGEHDMASLLFEPIEILMNLFTNLASFLRVAAFGLAHASLTMVIFILKDMVDSSVINFINVPVQHLFVIALEGMIVTIQCLRLEYYEFFSKFFNGDGKDFVPLVVDE